MTLSLIIVVTTLIAGSAAWGIHAGIVDFLGTRKRWEHEYVSLRKANRELAKQLEKTLLREAALRLEKYPKVPWEGSNDTRGEKT